MANVLLMSSYDDLYLFCKSEQIPVPANHLPIILGHNYELRDHLNVLQ